MSAGWMIDELDFAGPEHLDPGFVTGYEQKQGNPDPLRIWTCSPRTAWV